MLIDHCDHQIVLLTSLKIMLLFGTNMETVRLRQTKQKLRNFPLLKQFS